MTTPKPKLETSPMRAAICARFSTDLRSAACSEATDSFTCPIGKTLRHHGADHAARRSLAARHVLIGTQAHRPAQSAR